MRISCLHTIESNAALFDAVCPPGILLVHHYREDLLQRAIAKGEADEDIITDTAEALKALPGDAVLLTCTTLAAGAERAGALRVDAALAREAAREAGPGGRVEALITAPTTEAATREIFEAEALKTSALVEITCVEGALERFQAGDMTGYIDLIAAAADGSGAPVVALAQASMAPAAQRTRRAVMTSPKAGLAAAIEIATAAT